MKTIRKNYNKPGAAKYRDYWSIKRWFDDSAYSIGSIALDIGVHSSVVSQTIRGFRNSRIVLKQLVALGCPKSILSLPDDLLKGDGDGSGM